FACAKRILRLVGPQDSSGLLASSSAVRDPSTSFAVLTSLRMTPTGIRRRSAVLQRSSLGKGGSRSETGAGRSLPYDIAQRLYRPSSGGQPATYCRREKDRFFRTRD